MVVPLKDQRHVWLAGVSASRLSDQFWTDDVQPSATVCRGAVHPVPKGEVGRLPARGEPWLLLQLDGGLKVLLYMPASAPRFDGLDIVYKVRNSLPCRARAKSLPLFPLLRRPPDQSD